MNKQFPCHHCTFDVTINLVIFNHFDSSLCTLVETFEILDITYKACHCIVMCILNYALAMYAIAWTFAILDLTFKACNWLVMCMIHFVALNSIVIHVVISITVNNFDLMMNFVIFNHFVCSKTLSLLPLYIGWDV